MKTSWLRWGGGGGGGEEPAQIPPEQVYEKSCSQLAVTDSTDKKIKTNVGLSTGKLDCEPSIQH